MQVNGVQACQPHMPSRQSTGWGVWRAAVRLSRTIMEDDGCSLAAAPHAYRQADLINWSAGRLPALMTALRMASRIAPGARALPSALVFVVHRDLWRVASRCDGG
eukprot:362135-Chlamydomonas_euryale.AAC.6